MKASSVDVVVSCSVLFPLYTLYCCIYIFPEDDERLPCVYMYTRSDLVLCVCLYCLFHIHTHLLQFLSVQFCYLQYHIIIIIIIILIIFFLHLPLSSMKELVILYLFIIIFTIYFCVLCVCLFHIDTYRLQFLSAQL